MLLRATALRASAGGNQSNQSVDQAVDTKVGWGSLAPWNPFKGCEVYTDRPCGDHTQQNRTCRDGVSTCMEGCCVCPDGYCASIRIGYCNRCDDWDADAGGPGNSSCIHGL